MERSGFWKSGHKPSLLSAFLYFDVSFMIWVLIGPLAVIMMQDYPMSASQKANLVALPVLGGSALRLVLGVLADRIGPKRTGQIGMIVTMIPLIYGWQFVSSLGELYVVALLLGVAGASFSAALPLASRWYPPQYQGLAMGIAGAGNSGTVFSTLFANRIAQHYGSWEVVFGLALIPIAVVFIVFSLLAKDSPSQPEPKRLKDYAAVLGQRDTWLFCMLYMVTFGGFVGMSNYLTIFFNTEYGLSAVRAADFTTLCVIAGSFFRPVGGWLADRVGGISMLLTLYGGVAAMMALISSLPPLPVVTVLLFICMMCLGMGNGSVFQLVPQRFQQEIGVITGIVGAAGGLGGYFLPNILGILKEYTGSYTPGFLILSSIAIVCIVTVLLIQGQWKRTFLERSGAYDAYTYGRQS
ncbi:MAG: nitrate/nitrite transporter [Paenibacillus macerans]|uniref:MFS transporter n=1 Tax=Paenibacillus macerans TaxID=44252 RepID=A0A090ZLS1_PAEMA|nr:nitrate/nitrite transporter [Paenibacillus macerans]KFN11557.1 major Facilitator Superfamily protein [Paenibacillus macerans]MBS5913983.1 NarK/NasA family nitrate transporter [Paenibacillus macerans]MCY7558932.1 NarK/NasA family nitrate transporter [Paenibacillus macerans]MDU7475602.1 nitrate/nitrite transporter [Paenibacillus macerans]MEC0149440.1 NarK/NasA family nitrate transporter [Paenibacillus macerans]